VIIFVKGKSVIFDEEDMDLVNAHTWSLAGGSITKYAATLGPNRKLLYLHRLIIGAQQGQEVDHINGNKLDNRRCNLRIVSSSFNKLNPNTTTGVKNRNSGVRGVTWCEPVHKWRARINVNKKEILLGYFDSIQDAAKARKQYESTLWCI